MKLAWSAITINLIKFADNTYDEQLSIFFVDTSLVLALPNMLNWLHRSPMVSKGNSKSAKT